MRQLAPELSWTNSEADLQGLTPAAGTSFKTYPGCTVRIPVYATAVWYKVKFSYEVYVMEFNGTFTKAGGDIEGARVLEPHPESLISPSSFVNIANNYSWSGLITYQVSTSLLCCFRVSHEWVCVLYYCLAHLKIDLPVHIYHAGFALSG
jgi:hypothetical protein